MSYIFTAIAGFILVLVLMGVRIVPQSEKFIVERLGRLRVVLGPGPNLIVPFLDRVRSRVSVLERQLPSNKQDAITADNVVVEVVTSVFFRVVEPEKTVYRIKNVDQAIAACVAGIVRSEIGKMELDTVQSNRSELSHTIKTGVENAVDDWGIEVTRVELLDVNLDEKTRAAMHQQINAERSRRAAVTEAEGRKRAVELEADADLYAAKMQAEAKRVTAEADAFATKIIAEAINDNGMSAVQYQLGLKQVEALSEIAKGTGKQTILMPTGALDAYKDAFTMLAVGSQIGTGAK
ncbi:SPFH/Band 7/PHB domain protein [Sinirhodobacter populi]|uniref:SPFH/Band 7/PHB domain protein n=1 Tax=Paenirhodobacter populi TaxID=2306993 RepID=A0A443KCA5_9RHOB|nr:SPFH domain-containing protein [Sinirhodobacter populi]RWR30459.1 SPFH/Band 7/PHB domain protein [Sinirhodobacter populi]